MTNDTQDAGAGEQPRWSLDVGGDVLGHGMLWTPPALVAHLNALEDRVQAGKALIEVVEKALLRARSIEAHIPFEVLRTAAEKAIANAVTQPAPAEEESR